MLIPSLLLAISAPGKIDDILVNERFESLYILRVFPTLVIVVYSCSWPTHPVTHTLPNCSAAVHSKYCSMTHPRCYYFGYCQKLGSVHLLLIFTCTALHRIIFCSWLNIVLISDHMIVLLTQIYRSSKSQLHFFDLPICTYKYEFT